MLKKIKFVVCGLGAIGKRHAFIIKGTPNAQLVGIIEPDASKIDANPELSFCPFFHSIEDFISSSIQADVINICVPNGLHYSLAKIALKNGYHVVIEKPMALKKSDCEDLIYLSLQMSKDIFIVKQNRFSPPSQLLKNIVVNEQLGKIILVQINCFWNRDDRYYMPGNWKGTKRLDGGTLFTQFSHFIDIMYWIFGDIINVNSKFSNFTHNDLTEFEDTGVVNFEFINGGLGCITFTTSTWDKNMESSITVIGENGTIKIGGQYMNEIEYCHINNFKLPELPPTNPPNDYGPFKGSAANHHFVIDNVINTLNGHDKITANAMEGLKVVEIIERIYNSAK